MKVGGQKIEPVDVAADLLVIGNNLKGLSEQVTDLANELAPSGEAVHVAQLTDSEQAAIGHLQHVLNTLRAVYNDQEIDLGQAQGMIDQINAAIKILQEDPN